MPKSTDGYICVNGCGLLKKAKPLEDDDLYGHALFQIEGKEEGEPLFNLNKAFVVIVYTCPVCGYVELYDAPPIKGYES